MQGPWGRVLLRARHLVHGPVLQKGICLLPNLYISTVTVEVRDETRGNTVTAPTLGVGLPIETTHRFSFARARLA